MAKYNIGIIGAGNVGTHLCRAFSKAGHKVVVYTRRGATHLLNDVTGLVWTKHIKSFNRGFDFIIIAVNDDGILELGNTFHPEEGIVLHTSGNTEMKVLGQGKIKDYGVFYPLQSFHKNQKLRYEEIPVYIEANTKENLKKVRKLARSFSNTVIDMDSSQRKRLHLAAVVVNNFSNHLYHLSQDYLNQSKISFKNLIPLIRETGNRLNDHNPGEVQTGPAMRNDIQVLEEHFGMLEKSGDLKDIYKLISTSIKNNYNQN